MNSRHTPTNGLGVIPSKVGYGLVGRRNTIYQPHHFDVAPCFPLDHAARSHPVQVTVHVQLQQIARRVRRTSSGFSNDFFESQLAQIETIHKGVDHPHGMILRN
ncbi:hypothetical protein SAMN05216420_11372 [Nitrosospira sp. Nl5]|nr:hypothetical protein SAMN05216420_11372 [Nitrosospira sp. Nl5]